MLRNERENESGGKRSTPNQLFIEVRNFQSPRVEIKLLKALIHDSNDGKSCEVSC